MQVLAKEAEVSIGQVANVKSLLLDRELVESQPDGFRLRSFDAAVAPLLTEWAANYRASRNRANDFYCLKPIPEMEAIIVSQPGVALTGLAGAARLAPAVRYQRVTAYVSGDIAAITGTAGLKAVATGANITLIEPYDDGVFYATSRFGGVPVVSPVQLYLDLSQTKGRGEEAANAILKEVIEPLWR